MNLLLLIKLLFHQSYEYVIYTDEEGKLVKVCTTDKEPIIRKITKE